MSTLPPLPEVSAVQITRFLAPARDTIADVKFAWLATCSLEGGTNARAVHVHPGASDDDEWTRRFVVRRGSRKVAEMRAAPRVTLAFQHASGDAYVGLGGIASLIEDRAAMRALWSAATDARFPVRVDVDRVEVHVRGVTRDPFGHGRTLLQRTDNSWRFIPDH